MFTIKNLRKEKKNGWTYLKVDFDAGDKKDLFTEDTIWFAVESKNADMLTDDVYDAFAPFMLYLGMHYHQDVHIEGEISPRLYHNMTRYLMCIFDNFSKFTQPIKFTVDGFKKAKKSPIDLVGTGISCGVDSLTTLYDNFVETSDKDFRLNSLFLMNCGNNGPYEDENTRDVWLGRGKLAQKVADELGLPTFLVDSNLHAFTYQIPWGPNSLGYIAIYCCALALQRYIKRYLAASGSSYDSRSEYSLHERDHDIVAYCETYMPHLISTERFELVIDGCQYTRTDKIKKICDWDISKKYLNVCLEPKDGIRNCSACQKCARTLLVLEALDKMDDYKGLFDLKAYKKEKRFFKDMYLHENNVKSKDLVECLKENGKISFLEIPLSHPRFFCYRVVRKIKKIINNRNDKTNKNVKK